MSGIDDLIQELCPDGVEHTGVLDIADYVRGITYSKNDEDSAGEIQVLRANNITLASNTLNFEDVKRVSSHVRVRDAQRLRAGDTLICAGSGSRDHIGKVAYIREEIGQTFGGFMAVLRTTDARVESRFLFHLLTGKRFKTHLDRSLSTSTINNLNASVMRGFRVPLPPLEVQREIVRVLDKFTQLEAELKAELEARRAQYLYYTSSLFEGVVSDGARMVSMRDLGRWYGGGTPSKSKPEYWIDGTVPWVSPKDMGNSTISDTEDHITEAAVAGSSTKLVPRHAVVIVTRSSILDHTLPVSFLTRPAALNQDLKAVVAADGVLPRYLFHAIRGQRAEMLRRVRRIGGSVASLDSRKLWEFEVPVPSVSDQERVVHIMDRFDALTNDISIGLPAELAARRKQYEYYRDRLLAFKELPS